MINFIKRHCEFKVIGINGNPYLTRYYITPRWFKLFGLFLHEFHRGDNDRDLHNHPWLFALSYILKGHYQEMRLTRSLDIIKRSQGRFNFIPGWCFHRITYITPGLHTLFFVGPRSKKWGFLRAREDHVVFEPARGQR